MRVTSSAEIVVWAICVGAVACGSTPTPLWSLDASDAGSGDVSDSSDAPDAAPDSGPSADAVADGADGSPDVGVDVMADVGGAIRATVAVSVSYEDRVYGPEGFTGDLVVLPARSILVEVFRVTDGERLASGTTGPDGRATFTFDAVAGEPIQAVASATGDVDGLRVDVRDRSRRSSVYALATDPFAAAGNVPVVLVATADSGLGGAMNIADRTGDGLRFIRRFSSDDAPKLIYAWEAGRPFACGSCFTDPVIELGGQVEDPDEYDDDIILHEFGHYLVRYFGADDSSGGTHRDRQVDPWLAYGEGLAYFLSSAIRDDPTMVDNFLDDARFIDYETVTIGGQALDVFRGTDDGTIAGRLREEIVAGILWDAYDGPSDDEPWDQVSLGDDAVALVFDYFGAGMPVDVGLEGIELTDYLNALACALGDPAPVQALADDREFPWDVAAGMRCDFKRALPKP